MKARNPTTTGPGDDEVRLLLDRYKCPIPFHEVRTRFLGNIASPVMSASPIETAKGLHRLALTRRQELDGFVEGLFGTQEHIDLPERAHRALNSLSEMRAMLEGIRLLMEDETKTGTDSEIAETIHNVRELTKIAEHEMHEAVYF